MTWVRVDNRFPEHPKLEQLVGEPAKWAKAVALWLAASCYARRQQQLKPERPELHGWIPESKLPMLVPFRDAKRVAALLATAPHGFEHGLFEREGAGYRIHDFAEYGPPELRQTAPQPTAPRAAPIDGGAGDLRRKRREAGKKGAKARWQSANGNGADANGKTMANATDGDGKVPPPSPPNNPPNPGYSGPDPAAAAGAGGREADGKTVASEEPDLHALGVRCARIFDDAWERVHGPGHRLGLHSGNSDRGKNVYRWAREVAGEQWEQAVQSAAERAAGEVVDAKSPWAVFSNQPGRFYGAQPKTKRTRGPAAPAKHEDFDDDPVEVSSA